MNKLEKIKSESGEVIEFNADETCKEETLQETEKTNKFFSFFSFWKKANSGSEEDELTDDIDVDTKKAFNVYNILNKRTTVLASCVLIIAIAGYLNIRYTSPAENLPKDISTKDVGSSTIESQVDMPEEDLEVVENNSDYFALAVINRERVRDEAIEMLKDVAASDITDMNAKNEAYVSMTRMASEIASEANIESLVKAKGFTECVAVISDESANIVVETEGLTINEVAQIKEIVYLECGVIPDNIKIIEKSEI